MNYTEYYTINDLYYNYGDGFFLLTSLFTTLGLFLINSNVNRLRNELKEQPIIKPPTYSSA